MKQKSPDVLEEVLIDNDDVKVTRITLPKGATQLPDADRLKRVIISITDAHTERQEHANSQVTSTDTLHRGAGDAVFRPASSHSVTNMSEDDHVSVIVELKK